MPKRAWQLILAVPMLISVACVGPRPTQPRVDSSTLTDDGFQFYLNEVDLVTVDEAYRAMLILADGADTSENFAEREQKLVDRGVARSAWELQPDHVIDSGSVAFMVCRICDLKGGLNDRLIGWSGLGDRRYALRELIYRQMIDDSVDYQYMTGAAMFALMRKADALRAKKGLYESKGVDLTDEGDRDAEGHLIVPEAVPPASGAPTNE
ncbi:MAG: hypothetical protein H6818_04765 [Phycisphaerales bacterium]|nr:hypothetical protein [Phycisphaerales bacterium]